MGRSLIPLLRPRSIAVVGASRSRDSVGGQLFYNLLRHGFCGPVYPVNPSADVVQSVKAYRSVAEIPGEIDLAVLALPAAHAVAALEQCGEKGAKAAIVVSAGFRETGPAGAQREAELLATARRHRMRLLGPNCLGAVNTHPGVSLNATFADAFPTPGPVSFLSQSGALGVAILERAGRLQLGLSSFVSIGNRCDISVNDLLEYWHDDEETKVILLYLESFGNPRRFTRLARKLARNKPIVAVKSGRTKSGSRAAASHTGALAGADRAVDALFAQAGVVRVDTAEELFDAGMLLATQPVPHGRRVGIITNAGGPGILATDACENHGLIVPPVAGETARRLREFLPAESTLTNPVDMLASADAEDYRRAVQIVLADPQLDALMVIFVPPLMIEATDVAHAIAQAAAAFHKPVVTCFMGAHGFPDGLRAERPGEARIPSYGFPEAAANALSHAASYGEWLGVRHDPLPERPADTKSVVAVCRELAQGGEDVWLSNETRNQLLSAYGIKTPRATIAKSADEAAAAAQAMGLPVVLKLAVDGISHKSDVGGVILDLRGPDEVKEAFVQLAQRLEDEGFSEPCAALVQQYLPQGIEAVVGVSHDPLFGPLLMFGLGGVHVELIRDVVFRVHPLTEHELETMIWSPKAARLLRGYRGAQPADIDALKALITAVNQMVSDIPELIEMDLNPVMLLPPGRGCLVVDARVRLGQICGPRSLR